MKPALLLVALVAAVPSPQGRDKLPKDLEALQGEWSLVETADQRRTDPGDDAIRMIVRGSRLTLKFGAVITNRGTLSLGAGTLPAIDMKFDNGRSVVGVYEVTGASLRICVTESGQRRPESLVPQGSQWLETWKHRKP